MKPIVDEQTYCSFDCPFFEIREGWGYCKMLKQSLDFYDWYLASCVEDSNGINNRTNHTSDRYRRKS